MFVEGIVDHHVLNANLAPANRASGRPWEQFSPTRTGTDGGATPDQSRIVVVSP
jgi:hypothetical protein